MVYGTDDGVRCIVNAYMAWVCMCVVHQSTRANPHAQICACEAAFDIGCVHTCGDTRVGVFVSAMARDEMFASAVALQMCGMCGITQPMLDGTTESNCVHC